MNKPFFFALFLALLIPAIYTPAQQLSTTKEVRNKQIIYKGKVVKIWDGDTFDILMSDHKLYRIRMDAIDAPEKGMPFYKVSKQYLSDLIGGKDIICKIVNTDLHGRLVGRAFINGKDVSKCMLEAGLAWHYKAFNSEKALSLAEANAKKMGIGMWVENKLLAPWTVRKYRRAGYSDQQFRNLIKAKDPQVMKFISL